MDFVKRVKRDLIFSRSFNCTRNYIRHTPGEVSTYVNGHLCHVSSNLDPADLRLQYKLVVLGGGRQAQNRGGDLRRITIHSKEFSAPEMRNLYYHLAEENPAIGGRLVKIQAAFRGHSKVNISYIGILNILL